MLSETNILFISGGFLLALAIISSVLIIMGIFRHYKSAYDLTKAYKKKIKEVKKFKEDGGIHKWVTVAVRMSDGRVENTHACEHTGYCPAIEGFIEVKEIKLLVQAREQAEEYEEYKREKLLDFADEYCVGDILGLYDKMISIKKNFHIDKMNKFKEEIKNSLGRDIKVVSSMEELEEALREIPDDKSK